MKKTGHENRIVELTLLILQEHPRKMNIVENLDTFLTTRYKNKQDSLIL